MDPDNIFKLVEFLIKLHSWPDIFGTIIILITLVFITIASNTQLGFSVILATILFLISIAIDGQIGDLVNIG